MHFESSKVLTKKRKEITLRMIAGNESEALLNAMAEIAPTAPYILTSAEYFINMSVENEQKWINSYNEDPRSLLIVAQFKGKIVGILDFKAYSNVKMRHRGILGISLHEAVRGEGLGQLIFDKLLSEIKSIQDLMQIELSVMGDNLEAYHLYKKMGFKEVGRQPYAFRLTDGTYCDDVKMVLSLKNGRKI